MRTIPLAIVLSLALSSAGGQTNPDPLNASELAEVYAGQMTFDRQMISFPDPTETPTYQVRLFQPLDNGRFTAEIDVSKMLSSCGALFGCNEAAFSLAFHVTLSGISAFPNLESAPFR